MTVYSIANIPDPRVREKVRIMGACWFWSGATNTNGYGHFVRRVKGKQVKTYVHRYVYSALVGSIPPRHEVHHSCYNRWCCCPAHLSTMTHAVNSSDLPGRWLRPAK